MMTAYSRRLHCMTSIHLHDLCGSSWTGVSVPWARLRQDFHEEMVQPHFCTFMNHVCVLCHLERVVKSEDAGRVRTVERLRHLLHLETLTHCLQLGLPRHQCSAGTSRATESCGSPALSGSVRWTAQWRLPTVSTDGSFCGGTCQSNDYWLF